jgi:hypothetical protein
MNIQQLIDLLEHSDYYPDSASKLARDLRHLCAVLADRGQAMKALKETSPQPWRPIHPS